MKSKSQFHLLFAFLFLGMLPSCDESRISENQFDSSDLIEASVAEIQSAFESGQLSAVQLVDFYIDRIDELDSSLNSVLQINPEARDIARQLDEERAAGRVRSPLHGVPVLLKDNIDTADQMLTSAGSLALVDAPTPSEDAFFVQRLRESGVIILGKTNLSEWANYRSTASSSGWSGRGGQTHNPYILDRTPCGSSSGSGVAVSANLTLLAVGTETDGSVVCPSSFNGIVGIKPTLGLVSRSGIIPISHSQDTAGPMARSVSDAALLLSAMSGPDENDPITASEENHSTTDYSEFLNLDGLQGKRIGVARQLFNDNSLLNELMENQLNVLRQGGAILVDVEFTTLDAMSTAENEVLLYEFKTDMNKYLSQRGGSIKNLADLIAFNEANSESEMPYFAQELFEQAQSKGDLTDSSYLAVLNISKKASQSEGIDKVMLANNLDAIVSPSNEVPWLIDLVNGDNTESYISSSSLAAVSGYPSITVPAGFITELPIGLLFFGSAFSEGVLIEIAYAYEQITQARREPKFLQTNE